MEAWRGRSGVARGSRRSGPLKLPPSKRSRAAPSRAGPSSDGIRAGRGTAPTDDSKSCSAFNLPRCWFCSGAHLDNEKGRWGLGMP